MGWAPVRIAGSRVLAKEERLLLLPHHGEVRAVTTNDLTSRNLVVPFFCGASRVSPDKAATCSKRQCQGLSLELRASAVKDLMYTYINRYRDRDIAIVK